MGNFNFNKVILGGRLTAEPELKQTPSGISLANFGIAVNRRPSKGSAETQADFINCQAWRATAEFVSKYFHKGNSICVTGEIRNDTYTDKDGNKRYKTYVSVDEVNFVDGANSNSAETAPTAHTASAPTPAQPAFNAPVDTGFEVVSDEDMPF